ncbi:MAG TPA: 1,2-phenylacetyl-CoA epoxidase subunit PaaD [Chitinophagales bacterium]|nr:1,2-phenylacetyl-CoA epoxidase subunit PaaD [Chitinophagales bacterium]
MEKQVQIQHNEIWQALEEVKDPEIPVISVTDMGIITDVRVTGNSACVTMTPTFVACPAIDYMREQIKKKVEELGFEKVEVLVDREYKWSTNDISEKGKRLLKEFRFAPPPKISGDISSDDLHAACPHCGSKNTSLNTPFGSTLCRAVYYCFDCRQSFEQFKPK